MKLAIEAPQIHTLAIAGRDERFPVNRVFGVGRN
jgi:fumarylpyruvate hydrolase